MRLDYSPAQLKAMANTLRIHVIEELFHAGSGHPGGSLSIAEIMSVLYFHEMDVDPADPQMADRDRFVLSKGHAAPCYYAALAERGFFGRDVLLTLRKTDSILQGHPDRKKTPGVDMSTGSLGQGISAACGMALFGKRTGRPYRVYCVIGDGEMQEGQVWEALMSASHFSLDNLVVFLDYNGLQIDGHVRDVMDIRPVRAKAEAFGWHVIEADGNRVEDLLSALEEVRSVKGKPAFLLCRTVKGKGVSFMEGQTAWHGSPISQAQYSQALAELNAEEVSA